MITASNLGKAFGDRSLFAGVTLQLTAPGRYGLVGANGSGKTTLLGILGGECEASDGRVIRGAGTTLGVLRQDHYRAEDQLIVDVAMMGDARVHAALARQRELSEGPSPDAEEIAELEEIIAAGDGYTLRSRSAEILEGLGIPAPLHDRPMSVLSGGYKLRVLLAQTLSGRPDLLLLDEPTNHLDILTIRWLEKFLCRFEGCAVIISHDHRFLDMVATHILDIDYDTVTAYPGNYSRFLVEKEQTRARREAEIARQQKIIDDKKAFIERFRSKASKARQAQSRVKQVEKIEIQELPQSSRRAPAFRFEQVRPSGKDVLAVEDLGKSYGDKRVLANVSLSVRRGERVAIIGANGLGKSTLLRILVDDLAADAGRVTWGYEASLGYFPQDHGEVLNDPHQSALDFLWSSCPEEGTSFVRGQLGRMLFSGEDVDKKIRALSGGERARLVFSRIVVERPNVLLLDEPTNHLDLESIDALEKALASFPGTLLFVSHDRWFVSRLATRVIELTHDGLRDFPGSYEEYLAHLGDDHLDAAAVSLEDKRRKRELGAERDTGGGWQEQKRRRSRQQKLLSERERVTAAIDAAEKRLAVIQQGYCRPGFFEETPAAEVDALAREEAELGPRIEALMLEWEGIEQELSDHE